MNRMQNRTRGLGSSAFSNIHKFYITKRNLMFENKKLRDVTIRISVFKAYKNYYNCNTNEG